MDSSEEYEDSGNESSGEDVEFAMEKEDHGPKDRSSEEEYPFAVLSTEAIVQHMIDSIREVST
jgi:ariadne-1